MPVASDARATIIGSLNMDLVMRAPRMPNPGETLTGSAFAIAEGGKGANQAVAASRLGAAVAMVGRIGDDSFGRQLRSALVRDNIDTSHLRITAGTPTGVAMITVDDHGENTILLAPGANAKLSVQDIDDAADHIARAAIVVLQLEVPVDTVRHAARRARQSGACILLNPAPAAALPADLWPAIDILIPNETEAALLTGIAISDSASAAAAAAALRQRGVRQVLITLGARGVYIADETGDRLLPAIAVTATDTTAAGDCFIGGVVAGLCGGRALDGAACLGIAAAAVCVTRPGAQQSLPCLAELGSKA